MVQSGNHWRKGIRKEQSPVFVWGKLTLINNMSYFIDLKSYLSAVKINIHSTQHVCCNNIAYIFDHTPSLSFACSAYFKHVYISSWALNNRVITIIIISLGFAMFNLNYLMISSAGNFNYSLAGCILLSEKFIFIIRACSRYCAS